MAFFKRKEQKKPAKSPPERTIRRVENKPEKKSAKFNEVWRILAKPHITEKATDLVGKNQYVFEVFPKAGKTEIKKAVESLYGVNVTGVGIVNIPRRKIRVGRTMGFKGGYKKAIVRIKSGQKIEVLQR